MNELGFMGKLQALQCTVGEVWDLELNGLRLEPQLHQSSAMSS